MQTKKKIPRGDSTQEIGGHRLLRSQKKVLENVEITEKVSELITYARKQKAGTLLKKGVDPVAVPGLNTANDLVHDEPPNICFGFDAINGASVDIKDCNDGTGQQVSETIFSPSFQISKSVGGDTGYGDIEGAGLSSEVSAIYLAMKNSKLECVDEHGQDYMSMDVCVEDDDIKEFEDFDPYLFIKSLPNLSSVVQTFRPMLLPKQTRSCPPTTLVLDLDETLVHSTLDPCDDADFSFPVYFNFKEHTVYVHCRPYLKISWRRLPAFSKLLYLQLVKAFMRSNFSMYWIQRGNISATVFIVTPVFLWRVITLRICQSLGLIWHVSS